jgi:hypothetical protein
LQALLPFSANSYKKRPVNNQTNDDISKVKILAGGMSLSHEPTNTTTQDRPPVKEVRPDSFFYIAGIANTFLKH